jgi:hypothetical protein
VQVKGHPYKSRKIVEIDFSRNCLVVVYFQLSRTSTAPKIFASQAGSTVAVRSS